MPKVSRRTVMQAINVRFGRVYPSSNFYFYYLGLTAKQIKKLDQTGKCGCSAETYHLINMFLTVERQHWPTFMKLIEARYGKQANGKSTRSQA